MGDQILRANSRTINHLRIRVPGLLHTETIRMTKCPARSDVSPTFQPPKAASGNLRLYAVTGR
jgi:hypothetical protein